MPESDFTIPVNLRDFPRDAADPRRPGAPRSILEGNEKQRYGIQFREALTPAEEAELEANFGISLDAYVSSYTYIVLLNRQTLDALRQHAKFNADFRFDARYKISDDIGRDELQTPRRRDIQPDLLLSAVLFRDADVDNARAALERLGARDLYVLDDREYGDVARIEFTISSQEPIPAIAALEEVSWIEEVPEAQSNSPAIAGLVQSGRLHITPYWDRELRGQNQVIGVIDDGNLDIEHCWLKDAPNNDPRPGHRKVLNEENFHKKGLPNHCTYVAGIAVGDDIDDSGGHPDRGIAWGAQITYGNRGDFEEVPKKQLLNYLFRARAFGARIHTNSWHDPTSSPNYTKRAAQFDLFTWMNEDCLVIGSSGNEGEYRGPPGTAKNCLCVGAGYVGTGISCFGDAIPGPTDDGRRKPDLLAPGCGTTSAAGGGGGCGTVTDVLAGDTTPAVCAPGTGCASSYAAPVVAAAAAIVRQYFVEGWYPDGDPDSPNSVPMPNPTGALLKAVLLNATTKSSECPDYPSDREGWGLLQLEPILHLEGGERTIWVKDKPHAQGLAEGDEHTYTLRVAANDKPLNVTLVWTDYPGKPTASPVYVNDLDLEVRAPGATVPFKGNWFPPPHNESVAGGNRDELNNVEMVLVKTPAIGEWAITVRGTEVGKGRPGQGYAIAVSGGLGDPPEV